MSVYFSFPVCSGPRSYQCDSRVDSGCPTRGVWEGPGWTGSGLPSKYIARPPNSYGPVRMSKDVLTDVLVSRRHGWMLRGRRICYSMHAVQSALPGCRCCRTCTFTWCDGAPRRIGCVARLEGLTPFSHGRQPAGERRARDSLADCQFHGMYLANLIVRLWLRAGRSAPCQQGRPVLGVPCGTPCKCGLWRTRSEPVLI
jgi:hypothetical protein